MLEHGVFLGQNFQVNFHWIFKYNKLHFPSIIPSIMRAYGRQSFIAGMPQGAASLVETPGLMHKAESHRQERRGTQTQESKSSSGLQNLIITPGHRYLPSDQTQSQPRNAGGNEGKAKRNSKPEAWQGPWRGRPAYCSTLWLEGPQYFW